MSNENCYPYPAGEGKKSHLSEFAEVIVILPTPEGQIARGHRVRFQTDGATERE